MNKLRAYVAHFRGQRGLILLAMAGTAVATVFEAVLLVSIIPLASSLSGEGDPVNQMGGIELDLSRGTLVILALVAALGAGIAQLVTVAASSYAAARWQEERRGQLIDAYLAAQWRTQSTDLGGTLVTATSSTVNQAAMGLATFSTGSGAVFSLLILVATSFLVAPLGAAIMIVAGAMLFAVLAPLRTRSQRVQAQLAGYNVSVAQQVDQTARSARDLRLFHVGDRAGADLKALFAEHGVARARGMTLVSASTPVYRTIGILVVLVIIGAAIAWEPVSAAALGAAVLLLYRSLAYGQLLQRSYQAVLETSPFLELVDSDLARYLDDPMPDGSVDVTAVEVLEIAGVHYRYGPEGTDEALIGLNLRFECGELVAIVGASGSGKSTLAQLLLRLRLPTTGTMAADGVPTDRARARSWYRQVALVPQEPQLIPGTVADNIRFGRDQIDDEAVGGGAPHPAHHQTNQARPPREATVIGPGSRELSGGQVQRLAIARALVGAPSVLVLDEPTSALDAETEQLVHDSLARLRGTILTFVIAHRPGILDVCSRIVRLDSGRVTEDRHVGSVEVPER
jgi:ABC-type multidrug transport system fused ATPase/permease subunit